MSYLPLRFGLLAACLAFAACASAPEPRTSSDSGETFKRKKKKKKRKTVAEREAEERAAEKTRQHQEERARLAAGDDKADKPDKADKAETVDEPEKPEKLAKAAKPEPEPEASDDVTIIEDTEDEPEPVKKAKAKTKPKPKPEPKKKKKAPEPEPELADEEPAPKKKKNRELEEDSDEVAATENGDSDEAESKPKKKKPAVVAAKAKRKPKPAPKAEEEVPEIELDTEPEPEPPRKKKSKRDAEPAPADEGDVIDMESEEDDPLKERRVAAIPVPGVDDNSESDEPEPEELPPGTWPPQINDRPLTLAKDKLAMHGGLRVAKLTLETMPGVKTSSTAESFVLGGTYGLSDKLEVGFDYALGISPGSIKGPFTLHGAYRASVGRKLEVAIAAGFAVDFDEVANAATMTTTTTTYYSFNLGAWARYRVNRKASLFTGVPATPASPVEISKLSFPLPPLPYHLAVGLNNGAAVAFDMPVGLGYQVKPNIYAFGMLNLAHVRIRNTENAFLFADFIPLTLGGFYTRKQFDVGVQFSDDLKQGTDYLRLDLLLRYGIK